SAWAASAASTTSLARSSPLTAAVRCPSCSSCGAPSADTTRGPVKSTELHRHLREDLAPWFKSQEFKRAPRAQLGWHRGPLLVGFQWDQWGWDRYAGGSFFVNFQTSDRPEPWAGPNERLQHFLEPDDLEAARALQNIVIAKLSPPPREHVE